MGIIQQDLVWLLGSLSILIILLKLKPANRFAAGNAVIKLNLGLALIVFGAAVGMGWRLALGPHNAKWSIFFYLENLLGYLAGWCILVWGLIEWALEYYDLNGKPRASSRLKLFSDKLSAAVIKEHSSATLFADTARYTLLALDCQAVTLHVAENNGRLLLTHHYGLLGHTESLLAAPEDNTIIASAMKKNLPLSADSVSELGGPGFVQTTKGPATSAFCLPLPHALGVLSVYSTSDRRFGADDLKILDPLGQAFSRALSRERNEQSFLNVAKQKETLASLSGAFIGNDSIASSLMTASRVLYGIIPFSEVNLYLSVNGPVVKYDFDLHKNGVVNIIQGHFKKDQYPYLYGGHDPRATGGISKPYRNHERSSLIKRMSIADATTFWLEIRLDDFNSVSSTLPLAMDIICQCLYNKLSEEILRKFNEMAVQRVGALSFLEQKALAKKNLSTLLQDITRAVVDTETAAYCGITVVDPSNTDVKTVARSQARSFAWPESSSEAPGPNNPGSASPGTPLPYHSRGPSLKRPQDGDTNHLFPDGTKAGVVFPLHAGPQAVGYLIAGDFRGGERSALTDNAVSFVSGLALLASIVMTCHEEKRLAGERFEGPKKLTMIRRAPQNANSNSEVAPNIRSRINGPLAGILASCEYIQDAHPELRGNVGRYIDIIYRNAEKIHLIASARASGKDKRGSAK